MTTTPDAAATASVASDAPVVDRLGRSLHDLRISVTDRCNFRCGYCMPKEVFNDAYGFMPREAILSFEEIARVARIAVHELGVTKLRLTGGEPLLRRDLPTLVRMLAGIDGLRDLTLTTNGYLLAEQARALADAGLARVTVSLDALDQPTFALLSGQEREIERVLAGITAAEDAGLTPIKINCVVLRGKNEHAVEALARRFHGTPHIVRFIEFMDVGTLNHWQATQVVTADEIRALVSRVAPLEPIPPKVPGEVAERYRYLDGGGEVGIIASVTRPFCGSCNRGRLSADGRFLSCLFAESGLDLRELLRGGADDTTLRAAMIGSWRDRDDRYSEQRAELRKPERARRRLEMYQIGG
jgi:cyclic pyranopterin phosphate synthase